jgi:hypothetical protein
MPTPNLLIILVVMVAAVLVAYWVLPPFGSFGVKAS